MLAHNRNIPWREYLLLLLPPSTIQKQLNNAAAPLFIARCKYVHQLPRHMKHPIKSAQHVPGVLHFIMVERAANYC